MINNPKFRIALAKNGPFVALAFILILFFALNPRFLSPVNLGNIMMSISEIGVLALVFALLLMAGGVDLSVGSIASVTAVVGGSTMVSTGSVWLGIVAGLALGTLAGLLNGLIITLGKLNPIVVTLGSLSLWGGLALFITNGRTVSGLPPGFKGLASMSVGPISIQLVMLVVFILLTWFILNRRPFGRELLAVGGNEHAAYLMGIKVVRTRVLLYSATGFAAALAGLMLSARLNAAPPTMGVGMEVTVLIVVLLGGVAFEGGAGRITGVVAGVLIIGALQNGLVLIGVSQFLQTVFIGLTLIIAVALDGTLQGIISRSWEALGTKQKAREEAVEAA